MELKKGWIKYKWIVLLAGMTVSIFLITFLFFNSYLLSLVLSGITLLLWKKVKIFYLNRLNKKRENEFMVFIYSLSSLLSVGKSFEHAFRESVNELKKERNYYVILEDLQKVCICFDMNMSLSESLNQLARMYKIESILNFSHIIELAIIQGGSLEKVIETTVSTIQEKDDVEKELDVIVTQKRFELIIMLSFVPLIIFYLRTVSAEFSTTMYGSMKGRFIMLVCMVMYILSGYIGKKIVDIKV